MRTNEQCESTKRLLALKDDDLSAYQNRPLPTNWLAVKDASNMDEAVNARLVTTQEVALVEDIRRKSKNTSGTLDLKGPSAEAKERAAQAFRFTPPAKLTPEQIERLSSLNLITEYEGTVTIGADKQNWFKRLFKSFMPKASQPKSLVEKLAEINRLAKK